MKNGARKSPWPLLCLQTTAVSHCLLWFTSHKCRVFIVMYWCTVGAFKWCSVSQIWQDANCLNYLLHAAVLKILPVGLFFITCRNTYQMFLIKHLTTAKVRNSSYLNHDLFINPPTCITFKQGIWLVCRLNAERLGTVTKPSLCRDSSETREQRQWRFSVMSHIVALDCTEAHSQIRSCVPSSLCRRGKACCSEALRFSLLTQKVFQRQFKENYWEQHILLHNVKLNWNDRVVFSVA